MTENTDIHAYPLRKLIYPVLLIVFVAVIVGTIVIMWQEKARIALEILNTEQKQIVIGATDEKLRSQIRVNDLGDEILRLDRRVTELLEHNSVSSMEEYEIKKNLLNQRIEILVGSYEKIPLEFELFGTLQYSEDTIKNHAQTRYANSYGLQISDLRDITFTTIPLTGQWSTGKPKTGIEVSALYYSRKEEAVDNSILNVMISDIAEKKLTIADINDLTLLEASLIPYANTQCININLRLDEITLSKYPQEFRVRVMCTK
jgi:hypothetical protein